MKNQLYNKMQKSGRQIALFVLISRLLPYVSFDIVSYLAGLTSLRLSIFALVTFLGMIPIVIVLSFFGYALQAYQTSMLYILAISFSISLVYMLVKQKLR